MQVAVWEETAAEKKLAWGRANILWGKIQGIYQEEGTKNTLSFIIRAGTVPTNLHNVIVHFCLLPTLQHLNSCWSSSGAASHRRHQWGNQITSLSDLLPAEMSLNKPITMLRLSVWFVLMRLSGLGRPSLGWQHGKTSFFHAVFWVHVKGRFTWYCCRYRLLSPSPQQKWSAMPGRATRAVLSSEGLINNTASDSGSQPSWVTMKGSVRTNKSPGRQANLEKSS